MPLWSLFRRSSHKPQPMRRRARLEIELLEDRSLLSTTPGSISGVVFLQANGDPDLPGVAVNLMNSRLFPLKNGPPRPRL